MGRSENEEVKHCLTSSQLVRKWQFLEYPIETFFVPLELKSYHRLADDEAITEESITSGMVTVRSMGAETKVEVS